MVERDCIPSLGNVMQHVAIYVNTMHLKHFKFAELHWIKTRKQKLFTTFIAAVAISKSIRRSIYNA